MPTSDNSLSAHALAGELRVVICKLRRRLREQVPGAELTWSQKSVLLRLEREGPATVTALARAEGVRSQSMGATLSVLEKAGLIAGEPDPSDGRRKLLSLTSKCREWMQASRAAREDWLHHAITEKLTEDEQAQLEQSVGLLQRLAER